MTTANNEISIVEQAKFLRAYLECSDEIQAGIRDMLAIMFNPNADPDDKQMAAFTLFEALFPHSHEGAIGLDLEESEHMGAERSAETRAVIRELNAEEATFAERLSDEMKHRGLTQTDLAELSGVGQPAISNMLKRRCRPQRRTVLRFAEVLSVTPEALWPGFADPT